MHRWANGTSRISESFCRTDVEFLFFFLHQHQCDQTECVFICCVWASVFGLVIDGPACCLWPCTGWIIARVVAADLRPAGSRELWWTHRCPSVPGRNIMKPRGHSKLEQSEKESHFFFFTHSVSLHITKLWRLATTSKRSLITWQTCNGQLVSQWPYSLLSDIPWSPPCPKPSLWSKYKRKRSTSLKTVLKNT